MDWRLLAIFVTGFGCLTLLAWWADALKAKGRIPLLAGFAAVSLLLTLNVRSAEIRHEREQAAEIDPIEYRVLRSWRGADARLDAMVDAAMKDGHIVESEMEPIRSRLRLVQGETTRTELQHAISKDDPA